VDGVSSTRELDGSRVVGWGRSVDKLSSIFDALSATSRAPAIASSNVSLADAIDDWSTPAMFDELDLEAEGFTGDEIVPGVATGSELRTLIKSSMHLNTAPETPSSTLRRSSIASLVTLSINAS